MQIYLLTALLTYLAGFVAPLVGGLLLTSSKQHHAWRLTIIACSILLIYMAILYLVPTPAWVDQWRWNWSGKLAAIGFCLLCYRLLPLSLRQDIGLWHKPKHLNWCVVITITAAISFFAMCSRVFNSHCGQVSAEDLLFAATLPGLDEEFMFRGILLTLLNQIFGKSCQIGGARFGLAGLPILLFFGLAHGLDAYSIGATRFAILTTTLVTLSMGGALIWLKEKTGSLWFVILIHNLTNLAARLVCA